MIVVFRIDFRLIQTAARELRTKHYYVQGSVGIATGFLASILHRPKNERPFVLIPSVFQLRTRRFPISRGKVSTR